MIIVDDREVKSGICGKLKELNLPFEIQRLFTGDYIINKTVFIERKTTKDFMASLRDRRLFTQSVALRKRGHRAIMIIEGEHLPNRPRNRGALCSLTVKFYLPILRSRNLDETVDIMKRIYDYKYKDLVNNPYCACGFRSKRREATLQERILLKINHIGPGTADKILKKFGSIGKLLNASEKELLTTNGIGKLIAKEIIKLK